MEKEDIVLLLQILEAMQSLTEQLEKSIERNDVAIITKTKTELLVLQKKIRGMQ